jgi:hypothetical protein
MHCFIKPNTVTYHYNKAAHRNASTYVMKEQVIATLASSLTKKQSEICLPVYLLSSSKETKNQETDY